MWFQLTVPYATPTSQPTEPEAAPEENSATPNRLGIVRDVTGVVASTDLKPIAPIMQVAEFTLVETTSPAELNGTFTPSIDVFEAATAGRVESFAVSANHSKRTDSALEYDGKVEVNHPEFHIQADRLVAQVRPRATHQPEPFRPLAQSLNEPSKTDRSKPPKPMNSSTSRMTNRSN